MGKPSRLPYLPSPYLCIGGYLHVPCLSRSAGAPPQADSPHQEKGNPIHSIPTSPWRYGIQHYFFCDPHSSSRLEHVWSFRELIRMGVRNIYSTREGNSKAKKKATPPYVHPSRESERGRKKRAEELSQSRQFLREMKQICVERREEGCPRAIGWESPPTHHRHIALILGAFRMLTRPSSLSNSPIWPLA